MTGYNGPRLRAPSWVAYTVPVQTVMSPLGREAEPVNDRPGKEVVPMAMVSKIRTVGKAAGVATAAAPYAQKLMQDTDLRSSIRQVMHSVGELYERLSADGGLQRLATDDKVRRDVDRIIESLQSSARSVTRDTRRRSSRRALVIGVGLGVAASAVAVAAFYPRIRRSILSTAGDAREKISATVDDARGKVAASADDVREKASATVDELRQRASRTARDARGKVSEGVNGARKKSSDVLDDAGQKLSHGADQAGESASDALDEVRRAV